MSTISQRRLRVFIGHDPREPRASAAAIKSLLDVTNGELTAELLDDDKLRAQGVLTRPVDHRDGQDYDLVSNAPQSTRFAVSRFLTPILCQTGYALFVDADVVFREDPRTMLVELGFGQTPAVTVVKHPVYKPADNYKMVDQVQTVYSRKNWSSVMLFNCDHMSNLRLSLRDVNERPGRDLHRFYWIDDSEIGSLDGRWNWLVGEQPQPIGRNGIAHFTRGGPFTPQWPGAEHDDIWFNAAM